MNVIHFNSTQERLKFLRGEFKKIEPQEVKPEKPKKGKKKEQKDEVQAE